MLCVQVKVYGEPMAPSCGGNRGELNKGTCCQDACLGKVYRKPVGSRRIIKSRKIWKPKRGRAVIAVGDSCRGAAALCGGPENSYRE